MTDNWYDMELESFKGRPRENSFHQFCCRLRKAGQIPPGPEKITDEVRQQCWVEYCDKARSKVEARREIEARNEAAQTNKVPKLNSVVGFVRERQWEIVVVEDKPLVDYTKSTWYNTTTLLPMETPYCEGALLPWYDCYDGFAVVKLLSKVWEVAKTSERLPAWLQDEFEKARRSYKMPNLGFNRNIPWPAWIRLPTCQQQGEIKRRDAFFTNMLNNHVLLYELARLEVLAGDRASRAQRLREFDADQENRWNTFNSPERVERIIKSMEPTEKRGAPPVPRNTDHRPVVAPRQIDHPPAVATPLPVLVEPEAPLVPKASPARKRQKIAPPPVDPAVEHFVPASLRTQWDNLKQEDWGDEESSPAWMRFCNGFKQNSEVKAFFRSLGPLKGWREEAAEQLTGLPQSFLIA